MDNFSINTTLAFVDAIKKQMQEFKGTIVVPFSVTFEDHETEQLEHFNYVLLFHSPFNYTTVAEYYGRYFESENKFKFLGHHDSCWRDAAERGFRKWEAHVQSEMNYLYGENWEDDMDFQVYFSHGFPSIKLEKNPLKKSYNVDGDAFCYF